MDNQQATLTELAWLAGVMDGDGWIGFTLARDDRSKQRRTMVVKTEVRLVNTDEEIINKAHEIWNKLGVNPYRRNKKKKNRRRIHEIATKNMTGCLKILTRIRPYLAGNKKDRAQYMIWFIQSRKRKDFIRIPDSKYCGDGPRKLTPPYTDNEIEWIEKCRYLQANGRASETTRENQDKAVEDLKIRNQKYKELLIPDKI